MEDIKSISSSGRGRPRKYDTEEERKAHKNEQQRLRMQKKKLEDPDYGKKQYQKYKDKYKQCLLHITDPSECNGKFCLLCNKDIGEQTNFIMWNIKDNKPVSDNVKHTDLLTYITATIGTDEKFVKVANKYIQYCNNHTRWLEDNKRKKKIAEAKAAAVQVKAVEVKTENTDVTKDEEESVNSEDEQ